MRKEPVAFVVYVGSLAFACHSFPDLSKKSLTIRKQHNSLSSSKVSDEKSDSISDQLVINKIKVSSLNNDERLSGFCSSQAEQNTIVNCDEDASDQENDLKEITAAILIALIPIIMYLRRANLNESSNSTIDDRIKLDFLLSNLGRISLRLIEYSPLSLSIRRSLFFVQYNKEMDFQCQICLSANPSKDNFNIVQTFCKHTFHPSCIATWLNEHVSCPYCRQDLIQ